MKFILGKKLKMSQIWKENRVAPVTVIEAGPIMVAHIRTKEKDGYCAVQVGFDHTRKRINKPLAGQLAKIKIAKDGTATENIKTNFRHFKEFKVDSANDYKLGDIIDVSVFKEGDKVKVSGISKAKGFQGVVKRYGFSGGPKTHGQKNRLRAPGSIGNTAPQRVMPGRRMAGRTGGVRITVKNLEVIGVNKENNQLLLKGAAPGRKGTLLEIKSANNE